MKERFKFLLYYFLFWVIYFIAAKVIFLGYHIADTEKLTLETIFGIFIHGTPMDFSMAGYLSVFTFILVSFSPIIKKSQFAAILYSYTFVMVFLMTFLIVADLQVYNVWGYRIDATPLQYLDSPRDVINSFQSIPILQLTLSFILLMLLANYLVYRVLSSQLNTWKHINFSPFVYYSLFITALLFIPIRGGLLAPPMNQTRVFFSKNNFANIAAINPCWNFFFSLNHKRYDKVNPYTYYPKQELEMAYDNLYKDKSPTIPVLLKSKPNVIILVWSGLSSGLLEKNKDSTINISNFQKLKKEGLFFPKIYASSRGRTEGLVAILSGFPSPPINSIVEDPNKLSKLPTLSSYLEGNGYNSSFYSDLDLEGLNIKSYLFNAKFNRIISKKDFSTDELTKMRNDSLIYSRFISDNKSQGIKPFFSVILNSDIFLEDDNFEQFKQKEQEADKAFSTFINIAKKQSWWNETLIIVVGDRGIEAKTNEELGNDNQIPMLWVGGVINPYYKEMNHVASQNDLANTLLGQLNLKSSIFKWSKNILTKNPNNWAFFSFNDGFSYITDEGAYSFDNESQKEIKRTGIVKELDIKNGKSLQQITYQDYLDL